MAKQPTVRQYRVGKDPVRADPESNTVIVFDPSPIEVSEILELKQTMSLNALKRTIESGDEPRIPTGYKLSDSGIGLLLFLDLGMQYIRQKWDWAPPTKKEFGNTICRITKFASHGFFQRNKAGNLEMIGYRFMGNVKPFYCCGTRSVLPVHTSTRKDTGLRVNIKLDLVLAHLPHRFIVLDKEGFMRSWEPVSKDPISKPTQVKWEDIESSLIYGPPPPYLVVSDWALHLEPEQSIPLHVVTAMNNQYAVEQATNSKRKASEDFDNDDDSEIIKVSPNKKPRASITTKMAITSKSAGAKSGKTRTDSSCDGVRTQTKDPVKLTDPDAQSELPGANVCETNTTQGLSSLSCGSPNDSRAGRKGQNDKLIALTQDLSDTATSTTPDSNLSVVPIPVRHTMLATSPEKTAAPDGQEEKITTANEPKPAAAAPNLKPVPKLPKKKLTPEEKIKRDERRRIRAAARAELGKGDALRKPAPIQSTPNTSLEPTSVQQTVSTDKQTSVANEGVLVEDPEPNTTQLSATMPAIQKQQDGLTNHTPAPSFSIITHNTSTTSPEGAPTGPNANVLLTGAYPHNPNPSPTPLPECLPSFKRETPTTVSTRPSPQIKSESLAPTSQPGVDELINILNYLLASRERIRHGLAGHYDDPSGLSEAITQEYTHQGPAAGAPAMIVRFDCGIMRAEAVVGRITRGLAVKKEDVD